LATVDDGIHVPPTTTAPKFPQETEVVKSPNGWSPVDLRTVDVSSQPANIPRPVISKATPAAKLQARKAVQLGFELIQRRAPYSARARFIEALRTVAHSLDDQAYSTTHATALRNALTAYEEASDFFPRSTRPDEEVNLHAIVGGHATPILQKAEPHSLSPRQCLREYLAYAEQEFAAALGKEELASHALYGLARLESATETTASSVEQVRAHRSMTLHQSCLIVNSNNFAAANELGVLLARYGKYEQAVVALTHCVRLSPQPTAWKNLANIHRQLGQLEQARIAELEARRALASAPGIPFVAAQPSVEWVDVDTFASMASRDPNVQAAQQRAAIPERVPVRTASKKRLWVFGRDKATN
jgi:tetratricopeptide (TPR) repeat protein